MTASFDRKKLNDPVIKDYLCGKRLKIIFLWIFILSAIFSIAITNFVIVNKPFNFGTNVVLASIILYSFLIFIGTALGLTVYILPGIIAAWRSHEDFKPIIIINLLAAWTVLFWVIPFLWSMTNITWEKIREWIDYEISHC